MPNNCIHTDNLLCYASQIFGDTGRYVMNGNSQMLENAFSQADLIIAAVSAIVGALVGYLTHRGVVSQERSLKYQYFAELRAWADLAANALSEAVHLCDLDPTQCDDPSFFNRRHQLKVELSALIDRGRWLFPNIHHTEFGEWKQEAYRGFRHPVLDALVYAYHAVHHLNYANKSENVGLRKPLVEVKRSFVSEVQKKLDPRRTEKEFNRAMKQQ